MKGKRNQERSLGQVDEVLESIRKTFIKGILFTGFLSFFISVLQLTLPLYTMQVYDRVLGSRSMDTLVMLAIVACGALVLYGMIDYIRNRIYMIMGDSFARELNMPTLRASVSESLRGGGNSAQAARDLNDIRLFMTGHAVAVPFELIWTPMFLAVLFLLHPIYGIVAMVSAVILLGFGLAVEMTTKNSLKEANDVAAKSLGEVTSALRNSEVIEAMGMLPAVAKRWRRSQNRMLALLERGNSSGKALASASRAVRIMLQMAVISCGVVMVIDQQASPGSMIAAGIIMGRILQPFEQLIDGWRQWVFTYTAYQRVIKLLKSEGQGRSTMPLPKPQGRLVVDRLSFVPPGSDKPVLRNISFSLEPGDVLGIVGPSAAGKSTLVRFLVGVWKPTAGAVYLDGHNVFLWEREDFGQHVGYLPQTVSLLDGTVRENISRMKEADPKDVVAAARKADVHEMIGKLPNGYDTEIGDSAYSLSGGQRQRIALARAVFGSPRLLILDEPNSNLDHLGEQALMKAISQAKSEGAIVVLVAHRPSVMATVDKMLVLKDGAVEQFGARTDVVKSLGASAAPSPVAKLVKIEESK